MSFASRIAVLLALAWLGLATPASAQPSTGWTAAEDMVVMIKAETRDGRKQLGGGLVFGVVEDLVYIVTAAHVIAEGPHFASRIDVEFRQRRALPVEGRPADVRFSLDMAVVVVRDNSLAASLLRRVAWANTALDRPSVWSKAFIMGFAKGEAWSRSPDAESVNESLTTEISVDSRFVARGHSGGGLFDDRWRLIGMVWADEPPFAKAYPLQYVVEELLRRKFPVNLAGSRPAPPRPAVDEARLSPISPPASPALASSLPKLADVTGAWKGRYMYATQSRSPVNFDLRLEMLGDACRGWIREPNTFGSKDASHLMASAVCQLDISTVPARLIFKKTYDGTGQQRHSVDYSGDISADRRSVKGIWRIGNEFGDFELSR